MALILITINVQIALIIGIINIIFFIILQWYMVHLFIKKLHEIILTTKDDSLLLVSLISKYTLLSIFLFLGTFILFGGSCVFIWFNMRGIGTILFIADRIISTIAFYLQFKFAYKDYNFLCHKFNEKYFKMVVKDKRVSSKINAEQMRNIIKYLQKDNQINQSNNERDRVDSQIRIEIPQTSPRESHKQNENV